MKALGLFAERLPVLRLIAAAALSLYRDRGALVAIAWPWLLLMSPILLAFGFIEREYLPQLVGELPAWLVRNGTELLRILIQIPFWSALAVGWQRLLLLDERPRGWLGARPGRAVLKFTLAMTALISMSATAALALAGLDQVPGDIAVVGLAAGLLGFVLLFASVLLVCRASLMLPATSIDRDGFGWREALALGRGHGLELAAGLLLCLAPNILLYRLVEAFAPARTALAYGLGHMGFYLANGVLLLLAFGYLALAYRKLQEPSPSQEPTLRMQPGHLVS